MTQIFTAKSVEDAKALAARTFGVAVSDIKFTVLEEPKRGLFGFKKGEAKVRATYESIDVPDVAAPVKTRNEVVVPPVVEYDEVVDDAADVQAEETAEESAAEKTVVEEGTVAVELETPSVPEETVPTETAPEELTLPPAPTVVPEETAAEEVPAEASAEKLPKTDQTVPTDEDLITGEPSEAALEKIEKAKSYLAEILSKMGVEAEFVVTAGAESAMIDIVAANNGAVIGKRGETLDALQYLTFMIANRGDREYYRIILNSANYRERRRKTLEELAAKIARNALRNGRQTTLEPMNPYERRIIHSAIAEIEGVTSRSVGEEPYRKVVISSLNHPNRRRNARNDRDDRRERGGRRDRNRRNDHRRSSDVPQERISMDSMKTSFEKDYKRPKAEDEINAGLYGKIEF